MRTLTAYSEHQQTTLSGKHRDSKPRSTSATLAPLSVKPVPHRTDSDGSQLHAGQAGFDRVTDSNSNRLVSPDISPPGTPTSEDRGPDSCGSSQISPIEEPQYSLKSDQMDPKTTSRLPVLRKDARKEHPLSSQDNHSRDKSSSSRNRGTRWDDYSGEPTTNVSGKSAQVDPGNAPFSAKATGSHSSRVLNWSKEQLQPKKRFAEVRSRMSKQDDAPPDNEQWKGPSGHAPMMGLIHEKSRSGSGSHFQAFRAREEEDALPDTTAHFQPSVVTTITANQEKPPAPKKYGAIRSGTSSANASRPHSALRKDSSPPRVELTARDLGSSLAELKLASPDNTLPAIDKSQPDQSSPPVSRSGASPNNIPPETAARASTPRSLAESSDAASLSNENAASIMSRKRPVPSMAGPGKKPVRKPTPSQAAAEAAAKGLSPEPQPEQPKSHIEALEQRQDTLSKREANISTIIKELDQVFQPTSAAYDMATRDEVKRTIGGLNNELAEIKREGHEVGLKLLRAWKKRDEQNLYGGGTGLWVKRVTS